MRIERQQALGVGPYQRSEARRGQANGFRPKRLKTRVGELELAVPQVRGAKFYPQALERGSRRRKATGPMFFAPLRMTLLRYRSVKSALNENTSRRAGSLDARPARGL
jgi:hypothetical protein